MKKPKVSVIIPVYGVERYIERCARSLFEQTLDDIEYIFVNDCSPDNSIELLKGLIDLYPYRKSQVQIVHHKINLGLPAARQTGISLASGDYLIHCDPDDWVDVNMFRLMYETAIANAADITICDILMTGSNNDKLRKGCIRNNKKEIIEDIIAMRCSWSLCNKLISRRLYSSPILYPIHNLGEDMVLSIQLLLFANKIEYYPSQLYFYRQNPTSIIQSNLKDQVITKFFHYKENTEILFSALHSAGVIDTYSDCLDRIKLNVKNVLLPLVHTEEYYILWKTTYPELSQSIWINPEISFKDKVKYILTSLHVYPWRY